MSSAPEISSGATAEKPRDHKWLILVIVSVAQLMVVLDATIVNIALPSAQKALGFSNDGRQWIVTSYALAFGSLLLLGGRIGDMFGRKWAFLGGMAGFAIASAVGGASTSFGMLVAARAAQGVFRPWSTRSPTRRSAGKPSACSVPSPAAGERSAWCSAESSPSTSPGAGASTSTSRSRPSPASADGASWST
jgi:hypothetical protein